MVKKALREFKRAIAVHDEVRAIREDVLTKSQEGYIRPFDEHLVRLNYFPDFTYCVTNHRNYGENLIRRYTNPADSASCTLTIVDLKVKVGDVHPQQRVQIWDSERGLQAESISPRETCPGSSLLPIPWLAIGVCYAQAVLLIGVISDRASFQWIMLTCCVPAHLVAGWNFGSTPYSTIAFLVSSYVIRTKRRRALIFRS